MKVTTNQFLARQLSLDEQRIDNTLELLKSGATIPFIARYRKEVTRGLDEVQIEQIEKAWKSFEELEARKDFILKTIEEQGKLTPKLKAAITETYDLTKLEDLYLPYKKKRKTRGTVAKEKGLEKLAKSLMDQRSNDVESLAQHFLNKEVPSVEDALQGVKDIIAEWINEDAEARSVVRRTFDKQATIQVKVVKKLKDEASKYKDYFDYSEPLKKCPSHRLLAMLRGVDEGFLKLYIGPEQEEALNHLNRRFVKGRSAASDQVAEAIEDAYKRLIQPSMETEFKNKYKEKADEEAICVFVVNLRQLLLSPPLGQKRTLAIDPGYRTGCKVVCLDEQGRLEYQTAIYPHPPQANVEASIDRLQKLVDQYDIEAIAVGNGTAGKETFNLLKSIKFPQAPLLFMVNENGASIYSASAIAREEFPDQDVTVRGAVSIGRRLMDPLAELVKIDPKSIGVGQYQHDVNQVKLRESLTRVVESCVNQVGINLNTASKHLLTYVSGLGPTTAENIVNYREEIGSFENRNQLKKVPRLGAKAFEQCAGFLRIRNAKNPLDNTAVHPESYSIVRQMAKDQGCTVQALIENANLRKGIELRRYVSGQVGLPTLKDIMKELEKPGLDPRGQAEAFEFKQGINTMEDLREGMELPGVVTNITKFGAFVDIGIKQDGLVHISELANRFVKDPAEVVKLNQKVSVRVIGIDIQRGRIHLSMKQ